MLAKAYLMYVSLCDLLVHEVLRVKSLGKGKRTKLYWISCKNVSGQSVSFALEAITNLIR